MLSLTICTSCSRHRNNFRRAISHVKSLIRCCHQTPTKSTASAPTRYFTHPAYPNHTNMSATTQTFVGPAREPSAELADATSTKPGGRKPPAKAADGGPNGGKGWDAEQVSDTTTAVSSVETDHVHRNLSSGSCATRRQVNVLSATTLLARCLVVPTQHAASRCATFARR